jgi:CBS domain-containing protein
MATKRSGTLRSPADVMRREFIALAPEQSLDDARAVMRLARLREAPVLTGARLVGVVRYGSVAARRTPGAAVRSAMEKAHSISPACSLRRAALLMLEHELAALPVVEGSPGDERVIGLLTERDLLRLAYD